MAVSYKDIIFTPYRSDSTYDPKIEFRGANSSVNTAITAYMYPTSNGTLSFEGSVGQLFSVTNDLTGSLYSVNDASGVASIDVNADGTVALAPYNGNVGIGTNSPSAKLAVNGGTTMTGGWNRNTILSATFPVLAFNSNNTKYSGIGVDYSTAASGMYFWVNGSTSDVTGTATNAMGINTGNFVTATGSFRSPIFYDSNDTSYYADPNGTSSFNSINYYNLNYQGNTDYGFKGTNVYADTINSGAVGDPLELCYHRGAYTTTGGSMRAPIFYDSDNTGYYVDPNSDSYLNVIGAATRIYTGYDSGVTGSVSCSAWFRSSGQSGWYNASYGGGIWMSDATHVRTYGSKSFYCDSAVYGTIFYDANDTAYYGDPNGTSSFATIKFNHLKYNNVSYISKAGAGTMLLVQNGRLYSTSGTSGGTGNYATGRGLNGAVTTFGVDKFKGVNFPNETTSPTQVGTNGMTFSYALFANGNLYTWGANFNGQLGLGNTTAYAYPTLSATGVTAVYSHPTNSNRYPDHAHLIIKKTDGYLYTTGYNSSGQLGVGDTTARTSWTQITALGNSILNVWNMGATWGCTFVQKTDYTIWACGINNYGQLGNGNTTQQNSFVNVTTNWGGGTGYVLTKVIGGYGGYTSGDYSDGWTGMLLDNGTTTIFRTCGRNAASQLGDGTTTDRSTPVTPNVGTGRIADVASHGDGQGGCYVLKADGNMYSWGYNGYGQLGNGTTTNNPTPAINATSVSALLSDGCVCYVQGYVAQGFIKKTDGYLYSVGYNGYGQLGVGDTTNRSSFTRVALPGDFYIQSLGWFATTYPVMIFVALSTDGRLYAWGYNNQYAIAVDSANNLLIPQQITPFLGG